MREFFNKPAGKIVAIALVLIGLGVAAWAVYTNVGPSEAVKLTRDRVFVDATTGKPFNYTLHVGDVVPVLAPSGKNTGYPAELCFWTKDGKEKSDPTPVLLNSTVGKSEPTFCPDCGRLVIARNPAPGSGVKVPPTKEEYAKGHSSTEESR